jgi:hypothetical protein
MSLGDGTILARGDDRAVLVAANGTNVGPRDAPWALGPFSCPVVVARRCSAMGATYSARSCGDALPEGHPALGSAQAAPAQGYSRSVSWFACAPEAPAADRYFDVADASASSRASVLSGTRRGINSAAAASRSKGDVWRRREPASPRDVRVGASSVLGAIDSDAYGTGTGSGGAGYGPLPAADPSGGVCAAPRRGGIVCLETVPTSRSLERLRVDLPGHRAASASAKTAGTRCTCFMTAGVEADDDANFAHFASSTFSFVDASSPAASHAEANR